ncbi:MAG: hypothetical protein KAT11_06790, partial [Phycisphaerae bacterium]|nr:hypothetical protein [Phycisphaerae bacterium]
NYRDALGPQAAPRPGPILDSGGKVLGQHQGIFNYTLGQRRGLGIAFTEPLYVTRICSGDNSVTLGTRQELYRRDVHMTQVNTFLPDELQPGRQLFGQIRSPGQACLCTVLQVGAQTTVKFNEPQFAPCPGQRLVLYDHDQTVVAGGTITYPDTDANFSRTNSLGTA